MAFGRALRYGFGGTRHMSTARQNVRMHMNS
jgi:hypothetical protein